MAAVRQFKTFAEVVDNDVTVRQMTKTNRSLAAIIVCLVNQKEELKRVMLQMDAICPRRIKLPNGTVMIYRCPDHLIP